MQGHGMNKKGQLGQKNITNIRKTRVRHLTVMRNDISTDGLRQCYTDG